MLKMHETLRTRKCHRILIFFSFNRIRAKNGAGKIYGDVDSLGMPSEKVSIHTEPVAPPPPREVCNFAVSLPNFKDRDFNFDDFDAFLSLSRRSWQRVSLARLSLSIGNLQQRTTGLSSQGLSSSMRLKATGPTGAHLILLPKAARSAT